MNKKEISPSSYIHIAKPSVGEEEWERQIAAFVNRALYRLFGHAGLPFR